MQIYTVTGRCLSYPQIVCLFVHIYIYIDIYIYIYLCSDVKEPETEFGVHSEGVWSVDSMTAR